MRGLIDGLRAGTVTPDEAVMQLRRVPFVEVGEALVDHHRALRQGMPEAVYAPGKTATQCVAIVGELLDGGTGPVVLTRATADVVEALDGAHPGAEHTTGPSATTTMLWRAPDARRTGNVLVVSAGTSDTPVVNECVATLRAYGFAPRQRNDVGVAGIHRLLAHVDEITSADAVVVMAGMEGALASVVGGLTARPVVAVPTSVGYGSSLEGVTALLAMHASCASGVTVVGIDNGFGAACAIARMLP